MNKTIRNRNLKPYQRIIKSRETTKHHRNKAKIIIQNIPNTKEVLKIEILTLTTQTKTQKKQEHHFNHDLQHHSMKVSLRRA
jgi:hypothetical protein